MESSCCVVKLKWFSVLVYQNIHLSDVLSLSIQRSSGLQLSSLKKLIGSSLFSFACCSMKRFVHRTYALPKHLASLVLPMKLDPLCEFQHVWITVGSCLVVLIYNCPEFCRNSFRNPYRKIWRSCTPLWWRGFHENP